MSNPETAPDPRDAPLTQREHGVIARTIGAPPDTRWLDDAEAAEYLEGYNDAA